MRLRGGIGLACGVALSACYGTPTMPMPDAGGGAAGADTAGRGGSPGGAGGSAGAGRGGSANTSGSAGAGGSSGTGGSAGTSGTVCSPACDPTHACAGGHCLLADAQQCVTASQCASGVCNPFYPDIDGDGYGAGQPVGFCTLTTAPIGYALQNGDCCDDAANIALAKLIHPGADFQTTSAGGICGITWDYDCSGMAESSPQTVTCNNDAPSCTYKMVNYPERSCGDSIISCGCAVAGPSCTTICSGTPGTVACK